MKTQQLNYLMALILLMGMTFAGCKKDKSSNTDTGLAGTDVAATQDAESQDAVADNIDNTADNQMDFIEANNFNSAIQKSALTGTNGSWSLNPGTVADTGASAFPKKITITFGDTTINNEHLHYTGSIVVTDSLPAGVLHGTWKNFVIRKIKFVAFGIASDSSSITVTGTRTVTRTSVKFTPALSAVTNNLRLDVKDAITANLTFTITCGNYTGSFTRVVDRTREALAHFEKGTAGWHQAYLRDTLTLNGTVSGKNLRDSTYSRVITTPITITRCALLAPIISAGQMTLTNGTKTATLTYTADGCKTVVTIAKGDKTKVIERKINRKFQKWW
jgi:hypothetical protein